jgi:uncharacterized protein
MKFAPSAPVERAPAVARAIGPLDHAADLARSAVRALADELRRHAARKFYHLPYFYADMQCQRRGGRILYSSRRRNSPAEFRGSYGPTAQARLREKGSLEHWLTERYCLYTTHRGHVYRGEIHHHAWPLHDAEAEFSSCTIAAASGIILPATAPSLLFARRLDVLIWPLRRADSSPL